MGDGDAGVGVSAGRSPPSSGEQATIIREIEPEEEPPPPSRDFRIEDAHRVGLGSLREKARDNIAAIRTLKRIEAGNREATEAEKALLVRYAGWGALPNVFHPYPPHEWRDIGVEVRTLLDRKSTRLNSS